jgi:hypothetical protein
MKDGKTLGSEEGKGLGCGLCCEQRKDDEQRGILVPTQL